MDAHTELLVMLQFTTCCPLVLHTYYTALLVYKLLGRVDPNPNPLIWLVLTIRLVLTSIIIIIVVCMACAISVPLWLDDIFWRLFCDCIRNFKALAVWMICWFNRTALLSTLRILRGESWISHWDRWGFVAELLAWNSLTICCRTQGWNSLHH